MEIKKSIEMTKSAFENSFAEGNYYNSQTQDDKHLCTILDDLRIESGSKVLDLGTGNGYLAFAIAQKNPKSMVVGLDIVSKTLEANSLKAVQQNLNNINFTAYEGVSLPFENSMFDVIATRYALHHFPDIGETFKELARVLKQNGQLFISDPTPNENDSYRFVDEYMKVRQDGHIKFYTENEFVTFASDAGLRLDKSYRTKVRFPRKDAEKYNEVLSGISNDVKDGYEIKIVNDEIFITEQVLNLSFFKL